MKKSVLTFCATLSLLLTVLMGLTFDIRTVKARGTIYIRADGSVDPPTANITTLDNTTYILAGNINDSIVVERDNILVDGAGNIVQETTGHPSPFEKGISLLRRNNVTIKNVEIRGFPVGISLNESSTCSVYQTNILGNGFGVWVSDSSNNTITRSTIANNDAYGIFLHDSNNNTISRNNITANRRYGLIIGYDCSNNIVSGNNIISHRFKGTIRWYYVGIQLFERNLNNTIHGNNITNNDIGISLDKGNQNNIVFANTIAENDIGIRFVGRNAHNIYYHNNFINNVEQVTGVAAEETWDQGYPSGGNYWSDYNGADLDHDGIGDIPHFFAYARDNYPLMGIFRIFNVFWKECYVITICNSTISGFKWDYQESMISFDVAGESETIGFCRIEIQRNLVEGPYVVMVDGEMINATELAISNSSRAFLYFTYRHSTHKVTIVPKMWYLYHDLLEQHEDLVSKYNALDQTYRELLGSVTDLQAKYDSLLATINDVQEKIDSLNSTLMSEREDIVSLEDQFDNLQEQVNLLNSTLQGQINSMNFTLTSGQEAFITELVNTRNLLYVFITITVILIAATVYLAIRKPKIKP